MRAFVLLVVLVLALTACGLGLQSPQARPLPVVSKHDDVYGDCTSGGVEVSFPPVRVYSTVLSICSRPWRPSDADAATAPPDDATSSDASATEGGPT